MHSSRLGRGISFAQPKNYQSDPEKIFPYQLLEPEEKLLYDRALAETKQLHHTLTDLLDDEHEQTFSHSIGVGRIATVIAASECDDEDQGVSIVKAALYHDIGKIFLPADILYKHSALSKSERSIIEYHSIISYVLAQGAMEDHELMAILMHHWFQDNPYPTAVQLEATVEGRPGHLLAMREGMSIASVVALADHAEAQHWRSNRPYRFIYDSTPDVFVQHVRGSVESATRQLGFSRHLDHRLAKILQFAVRAEQLVEIDQ